MNIDLLFTANGEAGLIASENLVKKATGIVLDIKTGVLTLEYVDSDYMDLNIPVEPEFFPLLEASPRIHVGAVKNGHIAQAYQIPFLFQDDPYRADTVEGLMMGKNPLQSFNLFLKRCVSGQPVHRDDLGNEDAMGCVLGDAVPANLKFAPHLARRHQMEVGPKNVPIPRYHGPEHKK